MLIQRLMDENRYDDFRRYTDLLKDGGIPESGEMAAWKIAAFAFAPLSGGAGEIKSDPYFPDIVSNWMKGMYPEPKGFVKFSVLAENGEPDDEPIAPAESGPVETAGPVEAGPVPENPAPVEKVFEATPAKKRKFIPYRKDVGDKGRNWENEWELLAANVDKTKKASAAEVAEWVFNHCDVTPDRIDPHEVPAAGAIRWLRQASSHSGFRDFMAWHQKVTAAKEAQADSRFRDTGQVLELIDEFADKLLEEEAAAAESE